MFNQWQRIIAVVLGIIIVIGVLLIGRTVGTQLREKITAGDDKVAPSAVVSPTATPSEFPNESTDSTPTPKISPQIVLKTTSTPSPKPPNPTESNLTIKTTPKTGLELVFLPILFLAALVGFLLKKQKLLNS